MTNIQIPLDIPDVEILAVDNNLTDDLIITVRSTKSSTHCRKCGKETCKPHGYGETIILRHLSILDKPVYIRIKLARYQCIDCDDHPTTTERPEWFNKRSKFTKAYEEYLMRMLVGSTISDVSEKEYLTCEQIEGVLNRQVATEVNWDECSELNLLGLDEIALKKGHKDFVVIVSAKIAGKTRVIAILEDRKKETVKTFLINIPEEIRARVKTVCTDMYDGYINAAKEVLGKKTKIVIDRFHVAKSYRKAVDSLRKSELKRLKKELSEFEYKNLKGAMWAVRKKEKNLKEEEKKTLSNLFSYSPALKEAYDLQQELTEIFDTKFNKQQAAKKIKKWIKKANRSQVSCFDKFIATLQNYWNEILNYFYRKQRKNSGFIEGLNNKIKTIKRRCYGIFNVTIQPGLLSISDFPKNLQFHTLAQQAFFFCYG